MSEYRTILERARNQFPAPELPLDGIFRRSDRTRRNRRIAAGAVALALSALVIGGWFGALTLDRSTPADETIGGSFVGTWGSADPDGSHPVLTIQDAGDGAFELELVDDAATVCDGAPATVTGTGTILAARMTVASPVLTCEGGEPEPVGEDLTFDYDEQTDTLFDSDGIVWHRPGGDPTVVPYRGMWPQTTLEEAEEAQRRAGAGDPDSTWQLIDLDEGPVSVAEGEEVGAPIATRFVEEQLGWEHYKHVGGGGSEGTWDLVFVRCEPGAANPLYPNDPYGGDCAPTIDQTHYQTVSVRIEQPVRQGPTGIWVVTGTEVLADSDEPIADADWFSRQYEEAVPPSEAELLSFVEAFLEARLAGESVETYLAATSHEIPFLYGTSAGRPYERFRIHVEWGPQWPDARSRVTAMLFADGGGVEVEQSFSVFPDADGRLLIEYGYGGTSKDGVSVGDRYGTLGGLVTFEAAPPWFTAWTGAGVGEGEEEVLAGGGGYFAVIEVQAPGASCGAPGVPATAGELAARIAADPDLDVTPLSPITIGGVEALRLDVVPTVGAEICGEAPDRGVPVVMHADGSHAWMVGRGDRMRVHLLAFPGDPARTLAILVVAPKDHLDEVLAAAQPILDTFEFATG